MVHFTVRLNHANLNFVRVANDTASRRHVRQGVTWRHETNVCVLCILIQTWASASITGYSQETNYNQTNKRIEQATNQTCI